MAQGKGLFHFLFGKKDYDEKRVSKEYRDASVAAGNLSSDEEIHALTGEEWKEISEKCLGIKLLLLYSSGSEEEGSYEYTFKSEKRLDENMKKKLKDSSEKQSGAVRLIFLSDQTFKILYIPA